MVAILATNTRPVLCNDLPYKRCNYLKHNYWYATHIGMLLACVFNVIVVLCMLFIV